MLLHDDHTFRFAYKRGDTATIQMMDPDKTEVSPGAHLQDGAARACAVGQWFAGGILIEVSALPGCLVIM